MSYNLRNRVMRSPEEGPSARVDPSLERNANDQPLDVATQDTRATSEERLRNRGSIINSATATAVRAVIRPRQSLTQAGNRRQRIMWTIEMHKYLMRCYYLCTKMETDQTGRINMLQMFNQEYPRFADRLDVQRLMDRKRYILRCGKLSTDEINDIKLDVQRELRRISLRRSVSGSGVSNRSSARISDVLASSNRISLPNVIEDLVDVAVVENQINQEDQDLLTDLRNNMDTAITEFYETDPSLRYKIPKLRYTWKLSRLVTLMNNDVLPQFVIHCEDLESLQYVIYCAAVAIVRCLGLSLMPVTESRTYARAKPAWMRRLEDRILKHRAILGRLTAYRNGSRSLRLCRKVAEIVRPMDIRSVTADGITELIDTHTQRLSALSKRLKRYTECTERKRQNEAFCNNEGQFYRQFRNDRPDFADGIPCLDGITQFWSNIWERPAVHNYNGNWLMEEIMACQDVADMEHSDISVEDVCEVTRRTRNWASPGIDFVQNYWYKKLTATHQKLAECFNKVLRDPELFPSFLTQGITYLLPKDFNTSNPAKYRPITCLPCLYKIFTSVISRRIQRHCEINNIMTEEQKGCKRDSRGCKDQLIIDSVVTGQAVKKSRNLSMAYIDYKKAFDSVPHSYLINLLEIYKIDPLIVGFMRYAMRGWRTTLFLTDGERVLKSRAVYIRRGIFQGDSLSPLWFCLALNPLSRALNSTSWGYQIHYGVERQIVTHSFYMDDLKLYAASVDQLHQMLRLTEKISKDIRMEFGIDKCKSVHLQHGHLVQTSGFELDNIDNEIMTDLIDGESYKFLGFMQLKHIHHTEIKKKLHEKFLVRVNQILGTQLNSRNKMKGVNTFAIPLLTYSFGIIKWSITDIYAIETSVRTALTSHRMHHRTSAVERVVLPREDGGRGFLDITGLCRSQVEQLRQYFMSSRDRHRIYEAVCSADSGYSALNLANTDYVFCPGHLSNTDKIVQWKSKELHGAHPYQLDSDNVDRKASNAWLEKGELFGETEGFMIAIQDRVIATRNYRKFILHQDLDSDRCRKCGVAGETIEHVINGCGALSSTLYTMRHNNVAKIIHQQLALKYNLLNEFLPYYKYNPVSVLENQRYKLYWDRVIITDVTVPANRPDVVIYDKELKKVHLIDIAVPLNHNLRSTFVEKITKYHDLAEELKQMWNLNEIDIVPIIISSTGIIPLTLRSSLELLDICLDSYQMQKAVILSTCSIVRRFMNHHNNVL